MMKVTESIWPYTMISRIDELMDESKNKWIVNLDLDYFLTVIKSSRGDRYLSHSSRHTQVPVPATTLAETAMKNGNSKFNAILAVVQQ